MDRGQGLRPLHRHTHRRVDASTFFEKDFQIFRSKFDSSRDRGEQFSFNIGKSEVIIPQDETSELWSGSKRLDIYLKKLGDQRLGHRSVNDESGGGGHPLYQVSLWLRQCWLPSKGLCLINAFRQHHETLTVSSQIPGDATLVFEIELFDFHGEDLTKDKDMGVRSKTADQNQDWFKVQFYNDDDSRGWGKEKIFGRQSLYFLKNYDTKWPKFPPCRNWPICAKLIF